MSPGQLDLPRLVKSTDRMVGTNVSVYFFGALGDDMEGELTLAEKASQFLIKNWRMAAEPVHRQPDRIYVADYNLSRAANVLRTAGFGIVQVHPTRSQVILSHGPEEES